METSKMNKKEIIILAFKSYYVVWKPLAGKKIIDIENSLNRTMQYGNRCGWKNIRPANNV